MYLVCRTRCYVVRSVCVDIVLPFANILIFYRHAPMDLSNFCQCYSPIHGYFVHLQSNFHMMNLYKNAVSCCVALYNFEIGPVSFSTIYWMLRQARKRHRTSMQLVPNIEMKKKERIKDGEKKNMSQKYVSHVTAVFYSFELVLSQRQRKINAILIKYNENVYVYRFGVKSNHHRSWAPSKSVNKMNRQEQTDHQMKCTLGNDTVQCTYVSKQWRILNECYK